MNNFLNLSIIAELSKKKDILLNDLITLFFRILPTVIIVSLISLILAYINFLILKNFKIQNGELYKSNIIFSNLTIINPEDSYFNDINTVLQQPINVKTLLRNFSISDLLKNTPELKDKYKIDIDKNFSKAALPKSNTVDLKFSIFSNSNDIQYLEKYFINYLFDYGFKELESLFEYKITQEKFQIDVLSNIVAELKQVTETEELNRLARTMEMLYDIESGSSNQTTPLFDVKIEPTIATKLNNKTLKLDVLKNYLSKIATRDKNVIYYEDFSLYSEYNSLNFISLSIYYLITSFFLSLLIIYSLLLFFYFKNNKS